MPDKLKPEKQHLVHYGFFIVTFSCSPEICHLAIYHFQSMDVKKEVTIANKIKWIVCIEVN